MTQEAQRFWDKQAKSYDRAERQFAAVYTDIIARTGRYLKPGDIVLDYGCATGNKTIELSAKVGHIVGLDISAGMINEAGRKKKELNISNISFTQGTIFDRDLTENSFDAVIAFGVIHLLEDNQKVIQRIHGLLKEGGLFISTTACMKERMAFKTRLVVATYVLMIRLGISPLHLNMFRSSDVEKLIGNQNFQIIEKVNITDGIPAIFIVAVKLL